MYQTQSQLSEARFKLGTPAFEAPNVLLYCLDSLQAMPMLPESIVGLTVTSPPYNIGKEYEVPMPLREYIEWTEAWVKKVHRITSSVGAFWLNLGYVQSPGRAKAIPIPYLLWDRVPFFLVQEVVWNYGAGVSTKLMFAPRNEKFLWYVKSPEQYTFNLDTVRDPNVKYPNQRKHGKIRVNPLGKNPTDVWQIPKVTTGENVNGRRASKERTPHPSQFPVAVVDRIVKACSNPGDLVFDPFMGSGTVAEAAVANGRAVLGFEINAHYVDMAAKRLKGYFAKKELEDAQCKLF